MTQTNTLFTKPFLKTLLWKQNKHHKHGVFLHTMRVAYYALINGDFKMLPAAFLHDIGKPLVAYQKEEDIALNEYSDTMKIVLRSFTHYSLDIHIVSYRKSKQATVNFINNISI
jgi:hypothetical protein